MKSSCVWELKIERVDVAEGSLVDILADPSAWWTHIATAKAVTRITIRPAHNPEHSCL
jgi:hypothetical protein